MPDIAILGNMSRGQEYYVFTCTKPMPVRVQTSKFKAKKGKERIQVYQGVIISTHNNENPTNATITVRKMFQGGGIEKVFLLNSPWLKTVEVLTSAKVRRGKLYYLRDRVGKSARLKRLFT